jgi:hypothetical protein
LQILVEHILKFILRMPLSPSPSVLSSHKNPKKQQAAPARRADYENSSPENSKELSDPIHADAAPSQNTKGPMFSFFYHNDQHTHENHSGHYLRRSASAGRIKSDQLTN